MRTVEIRQRWLDFFAAKDHTIVPSASLVSEDPTLLFTVAGMVPFIPYLSGLVPPPFSRATSVQKCIRTLDIEEVGKTTRHGTFFQMNGNFSFGDYFKEQAIEYAWELLTTTETAGGLGFAEKDLWVTVYEDDDEAIALWKKIAGLPENRIQRRGKEDNYWSTGQPGPAGPCSEIYFDRGSRYGAEGGPVVDENRYVEIWNLVFMQYLIGNVRSKTDFDIFSELPRKNIDTGMGLERVAFLKQGVENLYEIDQVRPVLDRAVELSGAQYGKEEETDIRLRVVADHVRSALMLLSDGVTPSNEGRGYVLRRLLRRTVRSMRLLGVDAPTFPDLFPVSRDAMAGSYPEVQVEYDRISRTAYAEEEAFLRTLTGGTRILDLAVSEAHVSGAKTLTGDTVFTLHDTFGFPIDLTVEIAEEAGLFVDRDVFERLMTEQKQRAKADAKLKKLGGIDLSVFSEFRAHGETVFTGYRELEAQTRVLGLIISGESVKTAVSGEIVEVILAETSLYAESGGQEADSGVIRGDSFELEVLDVQKPVPGLISHRARVSQGQIAVGDRAHSLVDPEWRKGATQAHSATHLVHAALRQVLGNDAHQSGSYNKAGYLRLDFTWSQPLSPETRSEIEEISNNAVRANYEVITRELPLDEAKNLGAMALFGEKYGDIVRVVEIGGPFSLELCAGTHVSHSAEIGMINLLNESSIGSTNRRIESLVGRDAFHDFALERSIVAQLTSTLKTPREEIGSRISELMQNLKTAEKKIAAYEARALASRAAEFLSQAQQLNGVAIVALNVGELRSADELRMLVTTLRERLGTEPSVVALAAQINAKPVVIVATNEAARAQGLRAGVFAKSAANILGGGGGGTDDLAQGGGTRGDALEEALSAVRLLIAE